MKRGGATVSCWCDPLLSVIQRRDWSSMAGRQTEEDAALLNVSRGSRSFYGGREAHYHTLHPLLGDMYTGT